jgi:hypothetical protein
MDHFSHPVCLDQIITANESKTPILFGPGKGKVVLPSELHSFIEISNSSSVEVQLTFLLEICFTTIAFHKAGIKLARS